MRGKVKVDVHAVKRDTPIPMTILCECKYWSKPVEQSVVYGFRSICSDVGAHLGLIISKVGFQSGASETREATNVHLLDFNAFQETFFEDWRIGVFMKLAQLSDLLLPVIYGAMSSEHSEALKEKMVGVRPFTKYAMFCGEQNFREFFVGGDHQFPIHVTDPRGDPKVCASVTVQSYREYFEIAKQGVEDARQHLGI